MTISLYSNCPKCKFKCHTYIVDLEKIGMDNSTEKREITVNCARCDINYMTEVTINIKSKGIK